MDISKPWQRFNYYTCVCFSVMGQRRLRISMGALGMTPEAGDASAMSVRQRKRRRKILNAVDHLEGKDSLAINDYFHCPLLNLSNRASATIITTALYNHMELVERGVLQSKSTSESDCIDSCGFPYYRTCRRSGRIHDAVLVKDAGISCSLLEPEPETCTTSRTSSMEGYLLNQLKVEYKDLSAITRKISAYTKDILQSLSLKSRKQYPLGSAKEPVAMQYVDKTGKPCLKLRLQEPVPLPRKKSLSIPEITQPPEQKLEQTSILKTKPDNTTGLKPLIEEPEKLVKTPVSLQREDKGMKPSAELLHRIYPQDSQQLGVESSTCSSSSIYNFLMMEKSNASAKSATKPPTLKLRHPLHTREYSDTSKATLFSKNIKKTVPEFPVDAQRARGSCKHGDVQVFGTRNEHKVKCYRKGKTHCTTAVLNQYLPESNSQTVNIRIVKHNNIDTS